ncbi:hypothetical protein DFJ73DRAFT_629900 [Zopfochytrium polystomum]|nr:hypothetical protein DFJ73DRAFT_629900 [Zopfochytrium polystomum]
MRALVFTKEAGIVIGGRGKNIAEVRDLSGAKVMVSENLPGINERVLTVTGPIDAVAKAFSVIATKFVEEQQSTQDVSTRHTSIRLLIPHSQMGSLIGKQGSKIKEFQELSGSKIVAAEDMLPNSTERTVTINGVVASIHIATYHVGMTLLEHPERSNGVVMYKPSHSTAAAAAMYGHNQLNPSVAAAAAAAAAHALPIQQQQIFIPNDMVGAIIGKGGSKINEIRRASGCQVKVAEDPRDGSTTDRLVTITGTAEANQMALYMLYQRLEAEKARVAAVGGAASAAAAASTTMMQQGDALL